MDDEAVSPVIGTILMVAIAVVLAATVFLIVRSLSDHGAQAVPPIGFVESEEQDRTMVPISQPAADWQYVTASSSVAARMALNAAATSASTPLPVDTAVQVSPVHKSIAGADTLAFCAQGLVPVPAVIRLTYDDHQGANQVLRDLEFKLLQPCV